MADVTFKAFAGINNALPAERLAETDLTAADNVDIDNSGQIARRAGSTLKVAGAAHSIWSDGDQCLYIAGSSLMQLAPDYSSSTLQAGLSAGMPTSYIALNGRVYWSNGMQSGIVADGGNRNWGVTMPDAPQLTQIAGTLTAGTYLLAITCLRADGQESGTGLPATIALPDNAGVRMAWPIPLDPDVNRIHVYISEPNGEVLYRAGVADVDGGADVTSAKLATPLNTQWMDQPPAGQCLAYHRGRIFIAQGGFLFATAALGYEYCDLRDYLALDGSTIAFVIGVEHGLFIGTAQAVYFLTGDRLDELSLKSVVDGAGVARSAVRADGFAVSGNESLAGSQVALFATALGICMGLPDGGVVNLSYERYRFTPGAQGAAAFRSTDVLNQYLLFSS